MDLINDSIRIIRSRDTLLAWYQEHRNQLIRILVVAVTILGVAYISPRIVIGIYMVPRMIFLAIVAVIPIIWAINHPSLPLVAIIPVALVVPFGISTGTATRLNAALLLLGFIFGLWILDSVVFKKPIRIRSLPVIPALCLIGSAVVSLGFGQLPWFFAAPAPIPAQIGGVMMYVMAAAAFLVMAHIVSEGGLKWMVGMFICFAGIYVFARILSGIFYPLSNLILHQYQYGSYGSLLWVWIVCLCTGQILFNKKMHFVLKAIIGIVLSASIFVALVMARDWTSGWFPPLIGLGFILWIGYPKLRLPVVLVIFLIAAIWWRPLYDSLFSIVMIGDNQYSAMTRVEGWRILFKIFSVSPIVGTGPSNYYFYTPLFPILGYSVSFNSHSNYIDLLVQTGLIGFFVFIWFMAQSLRLGLRLLPVVDEGFQKAFIMSAIGGVVGTAIAGGFGDWVIPFVYNVGFDGFRSSIFSWLFIGGIAGIERILQERGTIPARSI